MTTPLSRSEAESVHERIAHEIIKWAQRLPVRIPDGECNKLHAAILARITSPVTGDTVPARDGTEAQRGLNDIFPGDPYPVAGVLQAIRQRPVQAIGAGLSRRDWHVTEAAYNELRDALDDLLNRLKVKETAP